MRQNIVLITFILLLPVLAVLAHDLYIVYGDEVQETEIEAVDDVIEASGKIKPTHFSLSGLGRLWTTYALDSFNSVRKSVSSETWNNIIVPLIELPAALVAAIPLILFYLITAILWVLGIGSYRRVPKSKKAPSMTENRNKGTRKTYKRK